MRMAWWVFIAFLTVQIILVQYMAESFMAGHYAVLPYYTGALGLVLVCGWMMYAYFRKIDRTKE